MRWLALLLLLASPVMAGDFGMADQGYLSRANGMDWDDDFEYGDAQDGLACDDADTDGAVIVAEDIDGDSELEQQIYVIPATGVDDSNCGGPNATDACASVQYVIDNRLNADADADTEDIICLVGTSNEQLELIDQDGVAGTKTRTAAGWEVYDFQYPSDPNVIMGADRDQDGSYPPHDTDDTAVFEGGTPTDYMTFMEFNAGSGSEDTDRWEFAHFTIKDYCTHTPVTDPNENCGAILKGSSDGISDHLYWHDLHLDSVNKEHAKGSFTIWLYELWGQEHTYHALENILGTDISGYAMRGSGGSINNYLRVRNITANHYGCGAIGEPNACPDGQNFRSSATGFKMWGKYTYVEFINNIIDTDADVWNAYNAQGTDINTCVQNIWIRNNLFIDFNVGVVIQGGFLGGCIQRHADEIHIDSNEYVLQNPNFNLIGSSNTFGMDDTTYYTQDVYYTNNIFRDESATYNQRMCFYVMGDSPVGGADPSGSTIIFSNNTCHSDDWDEVSSFRAIHIDTGGDQNHAYEIKNNIIAGGAADDLLYNVAPTLTIDSDYNIFEDNDVASVKSFYWRGTGYDTLAQFSAASGTDANSKGDGQNACDVTFTSALDLHLDSGDTCAQDEGTTTGDGMSSVFTNDFDDDTRPQNVLWDIGADEYASGYTPVGACCDAACEVTTDAACTDWRGAGTTCSSNPCGSPTEPIAGFAEGVSFKGVSKE